MAADKSLHSICRWTFNPGKGGFVPSDMRPEWAYDKFNTVDMVKLVKEKIVPRMPDNVELGIELHYDMEEILAPRPCKSTLINTLERVIWLRFGYYRHQANVPESEGKRRRVM